MALDWVVPIPYLIASVAFAAVLFRQVNQKIRWHVTPPLEHRRTAYMFLVFCLWVVNMTLGIAAVRDDWLGIPELQDYLHGSDMPLAVLHTGAALAAVILFWFYWIDKEPQNNEPDKK